MIAIRLPVAAFIVCLAAIAHARAPAAAAAIRVQLVHDRLDVSISAAGGLDARPLNFATATQFPAAQRSLVTELTTVLNVRPQPDGSLLLNDIPSQSPVMISPLHGSSLIVGGKPYRGIASVFSDLNGTLSVVNTLDLDHYLYGVVPSEVPAFWPRQALEAQSIVARSYALARSGGAEHPTYDVESGEGDQVYGGLDAENPLTSAAVDATRNVVETYRGRIATTYYSACDGGHTATGDGLEDPEPYLVAKVDPYCALSPYMHWSVSVPTARFRMEFEKVFYTVGDIRSIEAGPADESGRLQAVTVNGSSGALTIAASEFRLFAGQHSVKSLRIDSIAVSGDRIAVEGWGFGHGVGMCQYGARGMALAGFSAADILSFYYKGALLANLTQLAR